jgi:diguanylate cyclase (GGDEF)-like protein
MIHIDPRTVILLAGVMSGFMAVILYALKRSYPPAIKGLGEWVVALMLVGVGSLLAFGVGYFPTVVSITLPRLLFPSGLFLCYVGMQRFFGVVPRFRRWVALIAGVALVQMWFTFVQPSFHARLVLSIGLVLCLFLAMANLLRQQQPASIAKSLTMGVVVVMLSILTMRLVTSVVFPVGSDIFDASPQQLLYVTSFSFLTVLLSVGLVLLATERLHSEMSFLATHDSLTNALTRRHLNAVCAIELDRSQRHGRSMALLIMDLDYFKAVNDNHGHLRGDRVLVDFVATANRLLRRPDQLARFGGEEFVALLPETSLEEALVVAERIRQACAQPSPETACTVSIGVTTNHTAGDSVDTLIARADAAMYQAKAKGRNRVESA